MTKPKLLRITTVPLSLEKLLEGQLGFMQNYFEVTAISSDTDRLKKYGKQNDLNVFPVEMTRQITPISDTKALLKLYKYLKKEKPTIVHTHTPKAGIVGMLAAKLAKVPIRLHTVAGLPLMEATGKKRKLLDMVEKMTYSCATKVYPNSKGLYDFIKKEKLTKPEKLKIIGKGSSNGIDTTHFNPQLYNQNTKKKLRNELSIHSDDFVFIFVGRLVGDKGINELVQAFKNLKSKFKNLKLLLVGPFESALDPLKHPTLKEIEENSNIISVGFQQDVRPYFSISNALAFPSYREGFPNVVMQAGAMGLPSIVTDINGCNEIIKDGENGLIIPPKEVVALQKAMERLIINNDLYNHLQQTSREMIVNRYQREEVWQALLEEYQILLQEKGISSLEN
ncbi:MULTISPECIES: glycosyltransferase family 4 protein [Mesonia]|uniref:Glycosyltransferase EpsD n=1 Tax=Mesonia oceanica TaxID=2687242 RepID=A0AC61Y5G1_9FLAO|nr:MULTISPECIES: glycosyltransferase family 4 protein [Mesonia]MAN28942.1 glycosyltransferase family 1 protein [Mesonia sp.]MAQ42722.1 glycosyltransferase family 1 protein [Mesonia sp.]MBJ99260.1 glycosyltransferase family 1 protein [Flavobacteriaceae bacterium]VVU99741.1 Putative glycosyltransferase EpsD [Mesonia oceanica]|tara:strand:- start:13997 stop:15178 length:1182 start_codon:yes stop_codon:yes gene_type:complete